MTFFIIRIRTLFDFVIPVLKSPSLKTSELFLRKQRSNQRVNIKEKKIETNNMGFKM